ncbi:MAG: GNAT family N-acetyltransferase [Gammaproteobacteria bacterium]|jgi:GNAT superfamily N-acetyltransferase|nr:GNAT family N-acetyltransferase [Gammaproteobacteria bacterium]
MRDDGRLGSEPAANSRSDLAFRPARPTEASLLSELAFRSKAHWGYSSDFMAACRRELTWSAEDLRRASPGFFVAEAGGSIVGFHALEPVTPEEFELSALFVAPDRIGQGIGRRLIAHARRETERSGAMVLTIQGDPNADGFYRAAGAEKVGTRPSDSIPGRSLPLFRIRLR